LKSVLQNGTWNSFASLLGMLLGIASSVLIVRQLTPDEYGALSFFIWVFGILGFLGSLSFPNGLTKIRSELLGAKQSVEAGSLTMWVFLGLFFINLILSGLLLGYAFLGEETNRIYLVAMALILIPNSLGSAFRSFFWANQRYRPVALAMSIGALLQFAMVVVTHWRGWGVPGYFLAFIMNSLVQFTFLASLLVQWPRKKDLVALNFRPSNSTIHSYLSFSLQSTLVTLITMVVWERSEVFFLQRYSNLSEIGYYNLAFTTFSMFLSLGWALINGFFPALSHDYGAGRIPQLQQRMIQGIEISLLFSIPICLGGLALISLVIPILYGQAMSPSIPVALVLYIGLIPAVLAGMLNICFSTTGHIKVIWILGLVMSLLNVGLSFVLVPLSGALGAAIANTSSQMVYVIAMAVLVLRIFALDIPWSRLVLLILSSVLTCYIFPLLFISWLGTAWYMLMMAIIAAAFGYFIALNRLGYLMVVPSRGGLQLGRWLQ